MENKERRVGSISMALALIVMGLLILFGQFNKIDIIDLFFKAWPLLLISLGLEIIYWHYKEASQGLRIKFDIVSIFLVGLILISNLGIYWLSELGLTDVIKDEINRTTSEEDFIETIDLNQEVKRLVIDASGLGRIDLEVVDGPGIQVQGRILNHKEGLDEHDPISLNSFGDTGYLSYKSQANRHLIKTKILLGSDLEVEIKGAGSLDLDLRKLEKDLVVEGDFVDLTLSEEGKYRLEVDTKDEIESDLKWTSKEDQAEEKTYRLEGPEGPRIKVLKSTSTRINKL